MSIVRTVSTIAVVAWAVVAQPTLCATARPMISGGFNEALILKADGTVWATGWQYVANGGPFTSPGLVPNLTGISISAGYSRSFVIAEDGGVWAWGLQWRGGLGNGTSNGDYITDPRRIAGLPAMTQIHCRAHCVALAAEGSVWAWGRNDMGQVGNGTTLDQSVPFKVPGLPRIISVVSGEFHSLALASDGSVWAWGNNVTAQTSPLAGNPVLVPRRHPDLSNVTSIAAGVNHNMALKADGTVWTWGANSYGQLGISSSGATVDRPVQIPSLLGVAAIAAGGDRSMAIGGDGAVWAWGLNSSGAIGTGDFSRTFYSAPTIVVGLKNIVHIAWGYASGFAIDASGAAFGWGFNQGGQLADNTLVDRSTAFGMSGPGGTGAFNVLTSQTAANRLPIANADVSPLQGPAPLRISLDATKSSDPDGSIQNYAWSVSNGQVMTGAIGTLVIDRAGEYTLTLLVTDNAGASAFFKWQVVVTAAITTTRASAMIASACNTVGGLRSDGTLFTWGFANGLGRSESAWQASTPGRVANVGGVLSFAFGYEHGLAVMADGTVSSWGPNRAGEIGDGSTNWRHAAVPVPGIANATAAAAGMLHSLVLANDGKVWAFGSNSFGQLGTGLPSDSHAPIQVARIGSITSIAASSNFSVAVRNDGTVWAWGENQAGQLGDGTTINRSSPVQVSGLAGISRIWCGDQNCFAISSDGKVWGWGANSLVTLGRPASIASFVPFPIPSLNGFVSFGIGFGSAFGVDPAGQVWVWGRNQLGQLGDGTRNDHLTPVKLSGVNHAIAVAAIPCGSGGVALRADGTLQAWGSNEDGAVGDGTLARRPTAVAVINETIDGVLDLLPEVPNDVSRKAPPFFTQTASPGALTDATLTVNSFTKFNPGDVGTAESIFVFALAPAILVKGATEPKEMRSGPTAAAPFDAPAPCVLAQLNSGGQLQAVSASNLQAYVSGVLSAQGQAVTVLNGIPVAQIGGATFYVGLGANAQAMLANGTNLSVVSVPGPLACQPQPPRTGWWWNPLEGGRGYSIEVQGNHIFFAAFHYDASGRSTWNVASGSTSLDGALFSGDLLNIAGGQTLGGPYNGFPRVSPLGSITLAFNDGSHGTMIWPGGTVPIERMNLVPGGLEAPAQTNQPESGWWWNSQESGRGFFIEWQKGYADLAGYMYDDNGNPIWYIAVYPTPDARAFSGSWWQFANGQLMGGAYKPATQISNNVAPVTIQFLSATSATMTLPNGRTTQLVRQRF